MSYYDRDGRPLPSYPQPGLPDVSAAELDEPEPSGTGFASVGRPFVDRRQPDPQFSGARFDDFGGADPLTAPLPGDRATAPPSFTAQHQSPLSPPLGDQADGSAPSGDVVGGQVPPTMAPAQHVVQPVQPAHPVHVPSAHSAHLAQPDSQAGPFGPQPYDEPRSVDDHTLPAYVVAPTTSPGAHDQREQYPDNGHRRSTGTVAAVVVGLLVVGLTALVVMLRAAMDGNVSGTVAAGLVVTGLPLLAVGLLAAGDRPGGDQPVGALRLLSRPPLLLVVSGLVVLLAAGLAA